MKQIITIIAPIILLVFSFVFLIGSESPEIKLIDTNNVSSITIPANIQTVLDKSCIGCHNTQSKNKKGRMKLDFDKFTNEGYSKGKLIGKLNGIIKSMKKGDMPPDKYLKKFPDNAISDADSKILSQWASDEANKLMGE